jgi:citrate lyase subunit beta/citryl-CoA lyase
LVSPVGGDAAPPLPPRSLLFVPAHVRQYLAKAAQSAADAVVLDLEDSVPADRKDEARDGLAAAARTLPATTEVIVRVNAADGLFDRDLAACAAGGIRHVLLPKVNGPADVAILRQALGRLGYAPEISILVESCAGVTKIGQILDAAGPLRSVALGVEDLRQELETFAPGSEGSSPSLMWAHGALVISATGAGVTPLGILGSLSEFSDLARLSRDAAAAWQMGYRGSYCSHPAQVAVLNAAYAPSAEDAQWAAEVLSAAREGEAAGRGAVAVRGQMVDAPLVDRAARIEQARAARARPGFLG